MGMIQPSREPYNPAEDLKVAGTFLCVCSDVVMDIPHKIYPGKYSIAIQFTVVDPLHERLRGKKTAIVCGQSIYRPKKGGKDSLLLQYMLQAGVVEPWKGCDPTTLLDKMFHVRCELYNGKAMVRGLMPATHATQQQAAPPIVPQMDIDDTDFDPSKMDD